jgi:hypothetical protein
MQPNHTIKNFFASLLIIVFTFQAGGGLYLHNYFHEKNNDLSLASGSSVIKYSCNCVSDFYSPFANGPQQKIEALSFSYIEHSVLFSSPMVYTISVFRSLRAPPVIA